MDSVSDAERSAHIERLVDAIDPPSGRWIRACTLTFCHAPSVAWTRRPREERLDRTLPTLYGEPAWNAARDALAAFASHGDRSGPSRRDRRRSR